MKPIKLCRALAAMVLATTTSSLDFLGKATTVAPGTQLFNQDSTRNPGNALFNQTGVLVNAAAAFPAAARSRAYWSALPFQ